MRTALLALAAHAFYLAAVTAEPIGTRDLAALKDIKTWALSPDKRQIAYQLHRADPESNSYAISWHVVRIELQSGAALAAPEKIAEGGEAILRIFPEGHKNGEVAPSLIRWSPDGGWIAFTRQDKGEIQLWRARTAGGFVERLTNNPANVEDFKWSDDGSEIYFSVGRDRGAVERADNEDGRDGFLVGEPMPPVTNNGWPRWPECVVQRVDSPFVADVGRQCARRLRVYSLKNGGERHASEVERAAHRGMVENVKTDAESRVDRILKNGVGRIYGVLSPNERSAAWFENLDPGKYQGSRPPKRLVVADVRDERHKTPCAVAACVGFGLSEIWWASDSNAVIFLSNDGPARATQSLYRWRPGDDDVRTLFRSDEFRVRDCVQAGGRLICIREGWTRPDHIASISLTDGSTVIISDPNPDFQSFAFTKVERLLYDDGKGVETYGHLVYPKGYKAGKRYPIVIVQYRTGGFLRGGTGDEQPIHVYAQNGMFVLSTNMPMNEALLAMRSKSELDAAALFWQDERENRRGLNAILRALGQLEERGLIDSSKIGITGLSSGASIAEQALVSTDRFAAASAAYANLSPFAYYTMQSKTLRETLYAGLHPFSKTGLAMWRERSSGFNPDKVNEPYLLQVADREYLMTLQNYVDLKDAGKPIELFIFPNEYHVKWQPAHRLAIYNRNIDWMNFWLQGRQDPAPAKAEQFKRWRTMRVKQCEPFPPAPRLRRASKGDAPWYCRS